MFTLLVFGIFFIAILVSLDQISKVLAVQFLMGKPDIALVDGVLQLHYLENTGAAFSALEGARWLFLIITPIICVFLVFVLYRTVGVMVAGRNSLIKISAKPSASSASPQKLSANLRNRFLPLYLLDSMLLAGAIGNYLDRLHNGYVVDFIYFSLINFPVFNVADMYVTVSVIMGAALLLFYYKDSDLQMLFPKQGDKK